MIPSPTLSTAVRRIPVLPGPHDHFSTNPAIRPVAAYLPWPVLDIPPDPFTALQAMREAELYLQTVLDKLQKKLSPSERSDLLYERDRAMTRCVAISRCLPHAMTLGTTRVSPLCMH